MYMPPKWFHTLTNKILGSFLPLFLEQILKLLYATMFIIKKPFLHLVCCSEPKPFSFWFKEKGGSFEIIPKYPDHTINFFTEKMKNYYQISIELIKNNGTKYILEDKTSLPLSPAYSSILDFPSL